MSAPSGGSSFIIMEKSTMLQKLISPVIMPITLAQVKSHLRLDHAEEDDYLVFLIQGATEAVQNHIGRSLILHTWQKVYYHSQCYSQRISKQSTLPILLSLPYPPFIKINKIVGNKGGEIQQEIKNYQIKFNGDLAIVEINQPWIKIDVTYEAGYGDRPDTIPADIRQVILQLVGLFYQKRQSFPLSDEPYLASLMQPYRILRQV